MKSIQIEITFSKEHKYRIHLGNCMWLHFKSRTYLEKWVRRYKKILFDNITIVNNLNSQVYLLFRSHYLLLDDVSIRIIQDDFITLNQSFDRIFEDFGAGNQNSYQFRNIEYSMGKLMKICLKLKEVAGKKKITSLKTQVKPIIKLLSNLEEQYHIDKTNLDLRDGYQKIISLVYESPRERKTI